MPRCIIWLMELNLILAYECIPGIAKEFAKPRDGCDMLLPRMCRWISNDWHLKSSPKYDEVLKASYQSKRAVIGVLTPTEQELQAPYILNGQFNDSNPRLSHIVPLLSERKNVFCYPDSPTKVDVAAKKQKRFKGIHIEKVDTNVEQSLPLHEGETRSHRETHVNPRTFVGADRTISNDLVRLLDYVDEKFIKLQAHIGGRMDERFTKIQDKLERIDEIFMKIEDNLERIDERFTKIEGKLEDATADIKKQGKTTVKTPQPPNNMHSKAKRQRMDDLKCVNEETIPSSGSASHQIGHSMIQPSISSNRTFHRAGIGVSRSV